MMVFTNVSTMPKLFVIFFCSESSMLSSNGSLMCSKEISKGTVEALHFGIDYLGSPVSNKL